MIAAVLMGIGLVLTVEGLALALAPSRIQAALDILRALSAEQRRALGLAALGVGVLLIWLARWLAA